MKARESAAEASISSGRWDFTGTEWEKNAGMQSWFVPVCVSEARIWTNMWGNHQCTIINTQAVTSAPLPQSKNVVLRALWSLVGSEEGGLVRCETWTPQYFFVIIAPYGLEKTANQRKINKMTQFFLNSTRPVSHCCFSPASHFIVTHSKFFVIITALLWNTF